MARLCKEMGISDSFMEKLELNKIITVFDYLQEDLEKLSTLCDASFKEVLEVRKKLIANFSALPINGSSAYQHLLSNSALIPTGIEKLDKMLEGGFLTGSVTELCGISGDGKTQLCLSIAANVAASLNQFVHYIDTKNDFSAQRMIQILRNRSISEGDCNAALERVRVVRITSIHELIRHLHSLRKSLIDEDSHSPRVVIIDAIPPLYFPFLASDSNQGFGLLNHIMTTMQSMATEFHLLFISVNLASSYVDTESTPADGDEEEEENKEQIVTDVRSMLGKYWLHGPQHRLLVTKLNSDAPQRLIRVLKSTSLALGKSCVVNVSQQGIV